ncbi:hypothetical protein DID88_007718 [Monilinia fructigena]|uniref:Large ribosomal subunit protein uL10 n=1 Tax=Monilinia fructigena TaxID=38457 RepID=A0A395J3T8_9HELO|nr:hypothetical protein DID88_007718 [Monilinia fructigena]
MHEIRGSLRGEGVVLMGKNTMVRRAVKGFVSDNPEYERLLPFVKGNVGFVFTNGDLKTIRDKILDNKVAAPARAGAVAPADVFVPAGNTGMEPGKTSFFQALGVPTKIARGTIEITADLKLVEAGSKVGASEATLLNMLNISPFTYGMGISQVYDAGNTFAPSVLDIEESQLLKAFSSAITTIAAISLAANFPTLPSVMHSVVNSYKKVLAVAIETEYSWAEIDELKDRIANPEAYASAGPVATEAAQLPLLRRPRRRSLKLRSLLMRDSEESCACGMNMKCDVKITSLSYSLVIYVFSQDLLSNFDSFFR